MNSIFGLKMSFKREGNDSSLLSKLRKRRVCELLGESVPAEEAKLLSNGRFTCTVCDSVPIFDTVNMLVQHRQGKKHLANQQRHERKKRELNELIAKRKHQQFLKDGTSFIPMAASSAHSILPSAPYDPRVKRSKIQPTERKPRINLQTSISHGATMQQDGPSQAIGDAYDQDKNSAAFNVNPSNNQRSTSDCFLNIADQQISGPVMHNHQLKNLFNQKRYQKEPSVAPYKSKRRSETVALKSTTTKNISQCPSPSQFSHSCLPSTATSNLNIDRSSDTPGHKPDFNSCHSRLAPQSSQSQSQIQKQPSIQPPQPKLSHYKPADSLRAQKLRQLQGSGWKRDWDGKWIKDEDAEFDSDEEPPDIT